MMPYKIKGNYIYRKDTGKKVGCTKGDVKKYLAALHMNTKNLSENIETRLQNTLGYFLSFNGRPSTNGMKLSVQGKTISDVVELYNLVGTFLQQNDVAFKLATPRLIAKKDPVQSKKMLTIYVPDDEDFTEFAEKIYKKIKKYKGWYNIKTPPKYQHYAGGIFYRNDRDASGNYIPANVKEENSMTEKLERLIRRIVVEEKYKLSKGNKSTKNSFGDDKLKDTNSNPRQEFEDYPISYEEGMEKLKGIKDKDKLDREYEKIFAQMNNSHERNLFRGYYKILRDNLNQKR